MSTKYLRPPPRRQLLDEHTDVLGAVASARHDERPVRHRRGQSEMADDLCAGGREVVGKAGVQARSLAQRGENSAALSHLL